MNTRAERTLDAAVAAIVLVIFAPVYVLIAILICVRDGRPVVFWDQRVGCRGKVVSVPKFRTMREPRREEVRWQSDADRVTPLGRALRRTSLDELPQLLAVLRGTMSLVGPRPLPERYVAVMTADERRRLDVLPGMTGLAQLEGRNDVPWDRRLELDIQYVDTHSALLNVQILIRTLLAVVRREGVVEVPGSAMLNLDEERCQR